MVMDKNTGVTVQRIQTKADKVRSDVSYYNGRIYFSTQSGYLHSYNLTADGKVDLENLIEPLYFGGASTCTPAIYNNRLYIGISGGKCLWRGRRIYPGSRYQPGDRCHEQSLSGSDQI